MCISILYSYIISGHYKQQRLRMTRKVQYVNLWQYAYIKCSRPLIWPPIVAPSSTETLSLPSVPVGCRLVPSSAATEAYYCHGDEDEDRSRVALANYLRLSTYYLTLFGLRYYNKDQFLPQHRASHTKSWVHPRTSNSSPFKYAEFDVRMSRVKSIKNWRLWMGAKSRARKVKQIS